MTAMLDVENLDIHTRPTLDLTDDTIVGTPAPQRLPHTKATCILPDLDTCSDDDVSDLAANCSASTHEAADDLYALCGSSLHVRAICEQLGRREMDLDSRDTKIERLEQTTARLSTDLRQTRDQLVLSQGLGAEYQAKAFGLERELGVARDAHVAAEVEVNVLTRRNENLDVMWRTDRQRLEREANMHHETVNRLIKQTAESCKLTRENSRLTREIEVLRAALEKCERGK